MPDLDLTGEAVLPPGQGQQPPPRLIPYDSRAGAAAVDNDNSSGAERTVDLTKVEPRPPTAPQPKPGLAPYDPTPDRETKRGQIALLLVGTLVSIVAFVFVIFLVIEVIIAKWPDTKVSIDHIKVVVEMLLTPTVGLVGAVAGFYFGEKK
ncbi:MAG TPA: hypothetical protein VFB31_17810 [Pseudolabrys sp.]|nr:hypothetical protein [Pseudolabrys sp.]